MIQQHPKNWMTAPYLWLNVHRKICLHKGTIPCYELALGKRDRLLTVSNACRFFLHNWPELCWMAFDEERCFATVVCKLEPHGDLLRGYLAMLVVISQYRGLGIGRLLKLPESPQRHILKSFEKHYV